MPTNIKKLGVHGINIPAKAPRTVTPANFSIGGIIGLFERVYASAFSVNSVDQMRDIFGDDVNALAYGPEVASSFWQNLAGVNGTLYVKSHVGYNGSAIDGVIASGTVNDENGLSSVFTLLNEMRTKINSHAASAAIHTAGADTTNFPITAPLAQDLSTAIALTNKLIVAYSAHESDAALASAWKYHKGQESGTHALASQTAVTDLPGLITMLTDFRTKYNAHDADASAHQTASTFQLVSSAPSSTPVATLKISAAYQGTDEYGTSGNRTGYIITTGIRYATTLAGNVASAATSAVLTSVIGIKVGDIITVYASGGTAGVVQKKITGVDEGTNTVSWVGAFSSTNPTGVNGDTVDVPGFTIRTFRKSVTGNVVEVESSLGTQWCTMEPEVTAYYAPNVHSTNRYIKVTDQSSTSTLLESWPTSNGTASYLTAGAAGTSPTTAAHWSADLAAMNNLPIRMLTLCESSDTTIQKSVETYCKGRDDTPIAIAVLPDNQTKSQLLTLGSAYQRSDDVKQVNVADWLQITDPFNSNPTAPYRVIPNVGAVMGAWVQSIGINGIHYIPCVDSITLVGIQGLDNSNLGNIGDQDRTDIASYGVNIIQYIPGQGYKIRNFFTPSITTAYLFANGQLMQNYIKISAQNSLLDSENYPNSFNRIQENASAIRSFLYRLWNVGSTGNVPRGETFGVAIDPVTGQPTNAEDHFYVQADAVNNPQSNINLGQQTITTYFTYPSPAGTIDIQVGILLR